MYIRVAKSFFPSFDFHSHLLAPLCSIRYKFVLKSFLLQIFLSLSSFNTVYQLSTLFCLSFQFLLPSLFVFSFLSVHGSRFLLF